MILVAAAAVCLVLYLKKNRAIGNYMIVGVAALGICAAVLFTNFTSVDDYYGGEIIKDAPIGSVTVEIKCDTALIDGENAVILDKTAIQIEEGETVYDILMQVTRANSVTVDTVGGDAASSCYVRGIGGIYEFDHGDLSGWTFTVNGEKISTSCDKTKLSDGDTVVWYYSEALYE